MVGGNWADTSSIAIAQQINAADVKPAIDDLDQALYDHIERLTQKPMWSLNKNGSTQAIAHATDTKLTWSLAGIDVSSDFDDANDRIIPSTAGFYLAVAQINYTAMIDNKTIFSSFRKNGVTAKKSWRVGTFTLQQSHFCIGLFEMNGTTDYLEVYSQQNSSVAQNVDGDAIDTYFEGFLVNASVVIT